MKLLTLLSFTLIFSNYGISQQSYNTIDINGVSREYYQYLPTAYDPQTESLPVLFTLHGIGGTALATSGYGLNGIADNERFIPVYLQGMTNGWGQTSWNNGTLLESNAEDLAFISNLLDSLNADPAVNIDMSRVYMTGISMGSIMTYNACRYMSDRIAAVVCHIGTMSTEDMNNFNPAYPVPTLHKHGTNDQTVPYDTNPLPSLSLVPETIEQLKITNGWQGDSTVTAIPDLASDGITVDKIVYNTTTPLELWRMNDAGHVLLFMPSNDTNSTDVTWEFLKQHTHPNPSTASQTAHEKIEFDLYPNPTSSELVFVHYNSFDTYSIYEASGKLIASDIPTTYHIDVTDLQNGLYIFEFRSKSGQIVRKRITKE